MAALTDISDLTNRSTGGNSGTPEITWWHKTDRIAGTLITPEQEQPLSLWMNDGSPGGGALPPTSAAVPDNTTDGGLKQADPGGGRAKWLTAWGNFYANAQCTVYLYDRLLHISGLNATTTTAQTVGGTITRYTGTESWTNQVFVEINADIGATATTITMSYTNQDGAAGQTSDTVTFGGTGFRLQSRFIQIPLASGDTGVRAVASVTVLATTGTAGDFGIVIGRPLTMVTATQRGGGGLRAYLEDIPEIRTDACLAMYVIPHEVQTARVGGFMATVEA